MARVVSRNPWAWLALCVIVLGCRQLALGDDAVAGQGPAPRGPVRPPKPLKIILDFGSALDSPRNQQTVVLAGTLIPLKIDWLLREDRDTQDFMVYVQAKAAPSLRIWTGIDRTTEVFAEMKGAVGSEPTRFELADLPRTLWFETDQSGEMQISLRFVDRRESP